MGSLHPRSLCWWPEQEPGAFTAFSGRCVDFHTPASGWQPLWLHTLINGWKITHRLSEKTTFSQPLTVFSHSDGGWRQAREQGGGRAERVAWWQGCSQGRLAAGTQALSPPLPGCDLSLLLPPLWTTLRLLRHRTDKMS